jgi:DNA-binding CsgD family transcriptional regulator
VAGDLGNSGDRFSKHEIEILLRLSREHGHGKTNAILAASGLINACNELLSSRWTVLSAIQQDTSALNGFALHAVQVAPPLGSRATANMERLVAQLVQSVNKKEDQSDGIFAFGQCSEAACVTATLLADWSDEPNGTRLIVSAHRSHGMPLFETRDTTTMNFIRLACGGAHHRAEIRLPHRLGQVLVALERGLSEKECAKELQLSYHTVHTYVKSLHKRFRASSRGELLNFIANRAKPPNPHT